MDSELVQVHYIQATPSDLREGDLSLATVSCCYNSDLVQYRKVTSGNKRKLYRTQLYHIFQTLFELNKTVRSVEFESEKVPPSATRRPVRVHRGN